MPEVKIPVILAGLNRLKRSCHPLGFRRRQKRQVSFASRITIGPRLMVFKGFLVLKGFLTELSPVSPHRGRGL
jgi:hypothetical protein